MTEICRTHHGAHARRVHSTMISENGFHDPSGRLDYRDLPPSYVVANYPMELVPNSPVGGSALNGATRQVYPALPHPVLLCSTEWQWARSRHLDRLLLGCHVLLLCCLVQLVQRVQLVSYLLALPWVQWRQGWLT